MIFGFIVRFKVLDLLWMNYICLFDESDVSECKFDVVKCFLVTHLTEQQKRKLETRIEI